MITGSLAEIGMGHTDAMFHSIRKMCDLILGVNDATGIMCRYESYI